MGKHKKKRFCLECGEQILDGRTDKLYCSSVCRHRHYYKMEQKDIETRFSTIDVLDRNHKILSELIRKKVESIELSALMFRGFSPEFMTCCRRKARYSECGCYDIVYNQNASRIFSITKIIV